MRPLKIALPFLALELLEALLISVIFFGTKLKLQAEEVLEKCPMEIYHLCCTQILPQCL